MKNARQHVFSKVNNFIIKDLKNSEADEISSNVLERTMITKLERTYIST
jgi:hypothetical protein